MSGERPVALSTFSEQDFYLAEFRGRTLAVAVCGADPAELSSLERVAAQLAANATRVVLLSPERSLLEKIAGGAVVSAGDPRWVGALWRQMQPSGIGGLAVAPTESFAQACRRAALRLRVLKLVWIDPAGGLCGPDDQQLSFVDLQGLDGLLAAGRHENAPLREIRELLLGGVPSVAICSLGGLEEELFSYAGSGTFFTRERYTDVRTLALDEFGAAYDLIRRGVAEGYLADRGPAELEDVLSHAFGVFIEGRFLAGIGAMLPHGQNVGEIACLYTLTRFLGEGVGGHLLRFALERARAQGFAYVFACTTSERVEAFFCRNGFRRVDPSEVPPEKWRAYDAARRARVRCLRCD